MNAAELAALQSNVLVRIPLLGAIIGRTAQVCGLDGPALLHHGKGKTPTEARFIACYVARRCTRASYPEIGRALNRHHTTIMSAVARVECLRERDPWIGAVTALLLREFGEIEGQSEQ